MKRVWKLAASVSFALCVLFAAVAPAAAVESVLGYQYAKTHPGLVGRIWAYNWAISPDAPSYSGHTSSFYINADGVDGPLLRYIEAGIERNTMTYLSDQQRPMFFYAYEDYPNTQGQVWRTCGSADFARWHDVKIANYQPYAGGPSDWAIYFDGVARLSKANLSFKVGQPITASEHHLYTDSNYSSFDNMASRLLTGTHTEWTSIAYKDWDSRWQAFQVDGSVWRCIPQ